MKRKQPHPKKRCPSGKEPHSKHGRRRDAVRSGAHDTISPERAAEIVIAAFARQMFDCDVSDTFPRGYSTYSVERKLRNCWYVLCGPKVTNQLDGKRTLVCISKRTGRVLFAGDAHSG
jgi:hypothetical protein